MLFEISVLSLCGHLLFHHQIVRVSSDVRPGVQWFELKCFDDSRFLAGETVVNGHLLLLTLQGGRAVRKECAKWLQLFPPRWPSCLRARA